MLSAGLPIDDWQLGWRGDGRRAAGGGTRLCRRWCSKLKAGKKTTETADHCLVLLWCFQVIAALVGSAAAQGEGCRGHAAALPPPPPAVQHPLAGGCRLPYPAATLLSPFQPIQSSHKGGWGGAAQKPQRPNLVFAVRAPPQRLRCPKRLCTMPGRYDLAREAIGAASRPGCGLVSQPCIN